MRAPLRVFISYSHEDKKLKDQLRKHLKVVERFHSVVVWTDNEVLPGAKWRDEIEKAMTSSDVALLLVSASFLASEFIDNDEIPTLLLS
jgi:internalin A